MHIISTEMDILQDNFLTLQFRRFNRNGFIFEPLKFNNRYGTENTSGVNRQQKVDIIY